MGKGTTVYQRTGGFFGLSVQFTVRGAEIFQATLAKTLNEPRTQSDFFPERSTQLEAIFFSRT